MNAAEAFSPRRRELVALLLDGYSIDEIAGKVSMRRESVRRVLGDVYSRMGIRDGAKRVQLIGALSDNADKLPLPRLAPRERQVASLAIAGRTNPQIAVELEISVQVVKNYIRNVFDKCGVWSRTELAARYRCAETES